MITSGFDTGTTDSSWEWTVFTAVLLCELILLDSVLPRVPYHMKEGEIPVLFCLSTLYLHCTCTLKGWKNLAENKEEKKAAALKMQEKLLCITWSTKRTCNLQRKQSQAPLIATCCWWDGNSNSLAKRNHLDYLWLLPLLSRKACFY